MTRDNRVCLGAFAGAHGVRGEAKVKVFTADPGGIAAYGKVETEDGARQFNLTVVRQIKGDFVLVRAPEIKSREDAESLKGQRIYVERDALPAPDEDEFYLDDLVGLKAEDETGAPLGVVKAVYNFGSDDMIELVNIPNVKGVRLVAFTKILVPDVDIAQERIVVSRDAIDPEDPAPAPKTDAH